MLSLGISVFKEATVVLFVRVVSVAEEMEHKVKLLLHVVNLRFRVSVSMSVRYSSSLFDFVGLSSSLSFGNELVEHSLSISSLKFGEVKEEFEATLGG